MPYSVKRLYHPTHWSPNLGETSEFFGRVFGRRSLNMAEFLGLRDSDLVPGYPIEYCVFTPIAEVLFDSVDPTLHLVDGKQPYPAVSEPHLGGIGWFVDGIEDLWQELRRLGIRGTDQARAEPEGDGPPLDISSTPIIFTLPGDTGLSYEFCPYFAARDPRGDPPVLAVSSSDPLGIERCSHHTILTNQPDRALRMLVEVLGGQIFHEGRNDVLATQSTYILLADQVLELAQPLEESSPAMADLRRQAPNDTYHSLTWHVRDLDQAAEHLKARGVGLLAHSDKLLVADPADSQGVPWGFTPALTPGDPRA
jgi:hypothetical protein